MTAPVITGVSQSPLTPGDSLTVFGTNLSSATYIEFIQNTELLGSVALTEISDTQANFVVPDTVVVESTTFNTYIALTYVSGEITEVTDTFPVSFSPTGPSIEFIYELNGISQGNPFALQEQGEAYTPPSIKPGDVVAYQLGGLDVSSTAFIFGYIPTDGSGNPLAPVERSTFGAATSNGEGGYFADVAQATVPDLGIIGQVTGYVYAKDNTTTLGKFTQVITQLGGMPEAPVISAVTPLPMTPGTTITVTGVDVGICDTARISYTTQDGYGGTEVNQQDVSLTVVDQTHVTFTMPDMNAQSVITAKMLLLYTYESVQYPTGTYTLTIGPDVTVAPPAPTPPVSYGYDIPDGPMNYPVARVPWTFTDPYDTDPTTNTYSFPINPNAMTSPFPTKKINQQFTTAVDGQVLLTEGGATPAQWQFTGEIFNASHYEALRSWVYDRNRRIIVTDHFGRPITCVMIFFDAQPKQVLKKYWRHQYTITALVVSVGEPTEVPT